MIELWLMVAGLGLVILVIGVFFALKKKKLQDKLFEQTGKHPKGHYIEQYMTVGIAIGVAIGIAMDVIALGIPIGLALGYAIGLQKEKEHEKELRPLTIEEKEMKKQTTIISAGLLVLGIIVLAALFLSLQ